MTSATDNRDRQHTGSKTTVVHEAYLDVNTQRAANAFMARARECFDVTGAILFGSRARQSHRPDSDVDIAVLLSGSRGSFVEIKLALADIAYDVLLDTGVYIQPLPIWENEWEHPERSPNQALLETIGREGVRL